MKKMLARCGLVLALMVPAWAQAYVLGPTNPGKWGSPTLGTGATVSWSLMPDGVSCSAEGGGTCNSLSSFMPVGYLAEIQRAFDAWAAVANLTFQFIAADNGVPFNAGGTNADIRIGGHVFDGPSGTLAHGYYPPSNGGSAAGDIHFDWAENWVIGFAGAGIDIFQVMAHELGHALGLDHTGVANSLMNPFYSEAFSGPQADDIAGMRFLYGAALVNPPSEIPEPSSMALAGIALLAAAWLSRRRWAFTPPASLLPA